MKVLFTVMAVVLMAGLALAALSLWPTDEQSDGVETAEPMPTSIPGYRLEGEPRHEIIRVYDQEIGSLIPDLPVTMNGGDQAYWTVRWRTLNGLPIRVGLVGYDYPGFNDPGDELSSTEISEWIDSGTAGLVAGGGTTQPTFLVDPDPEYEHHLIDVAIEVQWWAAAP